MGVVCNHPNCIHRQQDRSCGLLARGETVVLNVIGQCEMRVAAPEEQTCRHCENRAVGSCAMCGGRICQAHLSWTVTKGRKPTYYCVHCAFKRVEELMGEP